MINEVDVFSKAIEQYFPVVNRIVIYYVKHDGKPLCIGKHMGAFPNRVSAINSFRWWIMYKIAHIDKMNNRKIRQCKYEQREFAKEIVQFMIDNGIVEIVGVVV